MTLNALILSDMLRALGSEYDQPPLGGPYCSDNHNARTTKKSY